MQIYLTNVNEMSDKQYLLLTSLVREEKQNRLARMKNGKAARMSLLGEILMRLGAMRALYALHTIENVDSDVIIKVGEHGKPFFSTPSGLHASVSHSGDIVACAIDWDTVGLDVEQISKSKPDLRIAKRYFASEEYSWLSELPSDKQTSGFFKLWTLKESYIKYMGKGFAILLSTFSFDMEQSSPKLTDSDEMPLHFFCDVLDGYALSCCSGRDITVEKPVYSILSIEEIMEMVYRSD